MPALALIRRARTISALALAIAVALPVAVTVPLASAAPADTTPDRTLLNRMQAEAEKAQRALEAGTKALEEGQRKLAKVQKDASQTRAAATAAQAKVDAAKVIVDRYAAAAYRHGAPSTVEAVMDSDGNDLSELLHGAGFLQIVDRGNGDALRQVVVARQDSVQLNKKADQLVAAAAKDKAKLDKQKAALQDQAVRAGDQMQKALAAYEAAVEKARKEKAAREAAAKAARDRAAKAAREAADRAARARAAAKAAVKAPAKAPAKPSAKAAAPAAKSSGSCNAAGISGGKSWGGFPNGMIPASALCPLASAPGHRLRADAALAFDRMSAAYAKSFGRGICVTDSYRSYAAQVDVYRRKPNLAAIPGRSNHGWGLAADLGCGIQTFGSAPYRWMKAHAPSFGFFHPGWAEPGGSKPEPWHWEFGHIS